MSTTASRKTETSRGSKRSDEESRSNANLAVLEAQAVTENSEYSEDPDHGNGDSDAQDGGRQGWICVIGGWFALFSTFGWLNS
jgi:hypothetical protein